MRLLRKVLTYKPARLGALLNYVNEADLEDNVYLTTEEGYLISEQDNKNNITIQED